MKVTCDVIKDLAELYVGDVLSDDSRLIVEEHVATCENCKAYIEMIKTSFEEKPTIDYEKIACEKASVESLRDKVLGKVLPFVIMTIVALTIVFISINYALFEHEIVIPYDGKTIYVTEDGFLHYPDCYDVAFIQSGSSEYMRVSVHMHYIDKIKGTESKDMAVVDLKEVVENQPEKTILYKDGTSEQIVWEKK